MHPVPPSAADPQASARCRFPKLANARQQLLVLCSCTQPRESVISCLAAPRRRRPHTLIPAWTYALCGINSGTTAPHQSRAKPLAVIPLSPSLCDPRNEATDAGRVALCGGNVMQLAECALVLGLPGNTLLARACSRLSFSLVCLPTTAHVSPPAAASLEGVGYA